MKKYIEILKNQEILGKDFIVYGDIYNPLFLAKDVADMIEHNQVARMIELVDEDEKLKCLISTSGQNREMWFLTEDGLYEILMQSRKPIAKQFKKEIKAILKQLRISGVVITESATQEAIDYESKYGTRRIRKTFRETTNLIETWNEFKTLSKIERDARRINNDVRIKGCAIIIDELQNYLANNITEMKTYEVVMYQETMQEILAEKNRLSNKYYGGLLSAQTKTIKKLEQQVEELTPMDLAEEDGDDEYYFIDKSGFTVNCMYSHNNNHVTKSPTYLRWINNLHLENYLPKQYPNVDFTKPLKITILFGQKRNMDTNNLGKAIIDQVANYYGFNDVLVHEVSLQLHDYVDTYEQGYMYIKIQNI